MGGVISVTTPGPRGGGGPTALIGGRGHGIECDLAALAPPTAQQAVRGVDHDAMEPRAQGGLAAKGIDPPDHARERVLDDFFSVLRVAGDGQSQAMGAGLIRGHEPLGRARLPQPQRGHEAIVTLGQGRRRHRAHGRLPVHRFPYSVKT
jgi:hypothetical protein